MKRYTVMTQTEGSAPEVVATFNTKQEALACITRNGGEMNAPLSIPNDDGTTTTAYNMGPEEGCPINWIETRD